MEATVVQILAKFRADVSEFNKRVGDVETQLRKLEGVTKNTSDSVSSSFSNMEAAATRFARGVGTASAVAGGALTAFAVKSFNAAARVDELDVALQAVGSSTGLGYEALNEAAIAVKSMGIEMEIAQKSVLKFAQNNLDMSKASEVARVAQDLAVIGGMNSTDAYNNLTHAIITGRSEVLKSVGIQKSAGQAYAEYARSIGKTTKELTYQEKQAAVLNLVLKEGERVAGTYEAAMTSPGKVLRSFARITNELQVAVGKSLIEAFGPMILQVYELYKNIVKLVSEGGRLYPIIQAIGAVLTNLFTPFTNAIKNAVDFTKGLNDVAKSADEAKARAETFLPPIAQIGDQIQRFLPILGAVAAGFATFGGQNLLKGIPILGNFLGMLNPVAVALAVLVALSPKLQQAFVNLFNAVKPLLPAFLAVGKVVVDVLNIAVSYLADAINFLSKVISKSIKFVRDHATAFQVLAGVFIAVAIAVAAYLVQVALFNAYSKVMLFFSLAQEVATKKLTVAFSRLNVMMRMNPIGLMVAAAALLVAGFVMLWNHSETFRKGVIAVAKTGLNAFAALVRAVGPIGEAIAKLYSGPLRLFLLGLSKIPKIGGMFKSALNAFNTGLDSISDWTDKAASKIEGFAGTLDKFESKRFGLPKFDTGFKMPEFDIKKFFKGKGKGKGEGDDPFNTGGLTDAAKKAIEDLRTAIQKYNDFIENEFLDGLMEGSDKVRDTVIKSLDLLKAAFEAKAQGLKGAALDAINNRYREIEKSVRAYIPLLSEMSDELVAIEKELENQKKILDQSLEAGRKIGALLRKPFGEPGELDKAMSVASATVDGVISLYDNLAELIETRFTDPNDTRKAPLLALIENQIAQIIPLIKERDKLIASIEKGKEKRDAAIADRLDSAKTLRELFASPFGTPSELAKALNSAETNADNVISMYGRLVDVINKRYAGLDETAQGDKSKLIEFLTTETEALLKVIAKRNEAVEKLQEAQKALSDIIGEQQSFAKSLTSNLRNFASVLAKVSDEESMGVIEVIKTATGLVITQIKKSSSGLDSIQTQLKERLASIRAFVTNAKTLLSRGLNREYLRQLIEAGPESAGLTLQALVGASGQQISEINSIYDEIFSISDEFGKSMAGQYYDAGRSMAEGLVKGAQNAVDGLSAEMAKLSELIMKKLKPLSDDLYDLGTDAFADLVKQDEARLKEVTDQMDVLKETITTALMPINAIGKTAGDDMMNGLVTALEKNKEALRLKIAEVAGIITSAMSAASASIGMVMANLAALSAAKAQAAAEQSFDKKADDSLLMAPAPTPTPGQLTPAQSSTTNNNGDLNIVTESPVDMASIQYYLKKQYLFAEQTKF